MVQFEKRVLFLGYGAVAQCALPIFLKLVQVSPRNITVMDFEDQSGIIREWTAKGVNWVQDRVTEENLGTLLGKYVGAGDLLVDLAWNIDCCELLQWCHDHGVLYVNASVELWNPYQGATQKHPTERTLYWRHMNIRKLVSGWKTPGPTAVIEHGANPGLISHWTRKGLLDIAARMLADGLA
jgi:homospermidine synthase